MSPIPPPLVSVIIPCFNAEATLLRALNSARAQTYANVEIIAVDDASRDGTAAILTACAAEGLLVFIGLSVNVGCAGARNAGIGAARGEFVAFLDADDAWDPLKLARQVPRLMANPRASMVGCRLSALLLDGTQEIVNATREAPSGPTAWKDLLRYSFYVPTAVVARRAAVDAIGGFDPNAHLCEDQDFAIRLALMGDVEYVDEMLGTMYQQPTSLSLRYSAQNAEHVLAVIVHHVRTLSAQLSPREKRSILASRYADSGRRVLPTRPALGLSYIGRGVLNGASITEQIAVVLHATPFVHWIKRRFPKQWERLRSAKRKAANSRGKTGSVAGD